MSDMIVTAKDIPAIILRLTGRVRNHRRGDRV